MKGFNRKPLQERLLNHNPGKRFPELMLLLQGISTGAITNVTGNFELSVLQRV